LILRKLKVEQCVDIVGCTLEKLHLQRFDFALFLLKDCFEIPEFLAEFCNSLRLPIPIISFNIYGSSVNLPKKFIIPVPRFVPPSFDLTDKYFHLQALLFFEFELFGELIDLEPELLNGTILFLEFSLELRLGGRRRGVGLLTNGLGVEVGEVVGDGNAQGLLAGDQLLSQVRVTY
jgi:hypothetical protein